MIIVTDALPAKRMSCYGAQRQTTPCMDALAAQGIRFSQAYSQTSWTVSSVASLFTGLEQETLVDGPHLADRTIRRTHDIRVRDGPGKE